MILMAITLIISSYFNHKVKKIFVLFKQEHGRKKMFLYGERPRTLNTHQYDYYNYGMFKEK